MPCSSICTYFKGYDRGIVKEMLLISSNERALESVHTFADPSESIQIELAIERWNLCMFKILWYHILLKFGDVKNFEWRLITRRQSWSVWKKMRRTHSWILSGSLQENSQHNLMFMTIYLPQTQERDFFLTNWHKSTQIPRPSYHIFWFMTEHDPELFRERSFPP